MSRCVVRLPYARAFERLTGGSSSGVSAGVANVYMFWATTQTCAYIHIRIRAARVGIWKCLCVNNTERERERAGACTQTYDVKPVNYIIRANKRVRQSFCMCVFVVLVRARLRQPSQQCELCCDAVAWYASTKPHHHRHYYVNARASALPSVSRPAKASLV